MKVFGIEFIPWDVPIPRRLQMLSVVAHEVVVMGLPVIGCIFFLSLLFTRLWWVTAGYAVWAAYDIFIAKTSQRGGRRCEWLRHACYMDWYRDYFPVELVKTADLDPSQNYILGYHPHGIVSAGAWCNFASNATGWEEKYPGVKAILLTLEINLRWPFTREYGMLMGCCSVTKESMGYLLTKEGKGNLLALVIGGAAEALQARPGSYKLTLKERKGFVKLALTKGTHLVPCYSFGENDLFRQADNPPGSFIRSFQEKFKSIVGISPPAFYGRGVFNYTFGFAPFREPIHTVVGAAIPLPHDPTPSQDTIDEYHQKYMEALAKLFDDHKSKYGIHDEVHLEFI